jgi:hypothetical protein
LGGAVTNATPLPPPPQPFLQQASAIIFKDDVNSFPQPRIFASCLKLTKKVDRSANSLAHQGITTVAALSKKVYKHNFA